MFIWQCHLSLTHVPAGAAPLRLHPRDSSTLAFACPYPRKTLERRASTGAASYLIVINIIFSFNVYVLMSL
jgi:hypothetical protein